LEFAQNLLEKQKFKCALTGLDLVMDINNTKNNVGSDTINTGSLDRIDSLRGYVEDNVQWVHKDINYIKMDLNQEKFIYYCRKVADYFKN
jgi:hypothetical protein